MATSLPFTLFVVWGGYWLHRSGLAPERYPRIAKWTLAGFVFFFGFFALIAMSTCRSWRRGAA